MIKKSNLPFVKCGKVFNPDLPFHLDASEPPIVLAVVNVNPKPVTRPCVLVKYSQFINFSLLGLNPKINIFYRLVRESSRTKDAQILQEWELGIESLELLEVANLDTNQPTVLNYCDCLDHHERESLTYKVEIVRIESNNVRRFGITNKSITATVISEAPECE